MMMDNDFEGVYAATPIPMQELDSETAEYQQYVEEHGLSQYAEAVRPERFVDYDTLQTHFEHLEDGGVTGIVFGCTAHDAAFPHDEHVEVVRRASDMTDLEFVAGAATNATWETQYLMDRIANETDADGLLAVSPYKNKPEPQGMEQHYGEANETTDLPVMLYNVPSRTGRNIEVDSALDLMAQDGISGIKEASGDDDRVERLAAGIDERGLDATLLSGNDFHNQKMYAEGGAGAVSVRANVLPEETVEEYEAAMDGEFDRVEDLHEYCADIDDALFEETNPGPLHFVLTEASEDLYGEQVDMGVPRGPLRHQPTPQTQDRLQEVVEQYV